MPFDSLPQTELTLARLAVVLRDRSMWPEGFEWDYGMCSSCAMGLAYEIKTGERLEGDGSHTSPVTRAIRMIVNDAKAMKLKEFHAIFWDLTDRMNLDWSEITPEHVADAIESYLANK